MPISPDVAKRRLSVVCWLRRQVEVQGLATLSLPHHPDVRKCGRAPSDQAGQPGHPRHWLLWRRWPTGRRGDLSRGRKVPGHGRRDLVAKAPAGSRAGGRRRPGRGPGGRGRRRHQRGSRAGDRKSTRLNSSHVEISYAVFCLKKKKKKHAHAVLIKKKREGKHK